MALIVLMGLLLLHNSKLAVFDAESEEFIKHINIPLCEPRGLAVTPDNYIIVADNHKIRKIDIDGKCIASVGKYGDKKRNFNMLAVSPCLLTTSIFMLLIMRMTEYKF